LYLAADSQRGRLRVAGPELVVDDRAWSGPRMTVVEEGLRIRRGNRTFAKVEEPRPQSARPDWAKLIGEYGWDYDTLYIFEERGTLHALIEWFFDYPLMEQG